LSLLDTETRRATREADRAEVASRALAELLAKAEAALAHDLKLERLVDEVKAIRKNEPAANILIYTEYVDSLCEIESR